MELSVDDVDNIIEEVEQQGYSVHQFVLYRETIEGLNTGDDRVETNDAGSVDVATVCGASVGLPVDPYEEYLKLIGPDGKGARGELTTDGKISEINPYEPMD